MDLALKDLCEYKSVLTFLEMEQLKDNMFNRNRNESIISFSVVSDDLGK